MSYALIIADHHNGTLDASLAATITAARLMADKVDVLLAADNDVLAKDIAAYKDVSKVHVSIAPHYGAMLAEHITPLACRVADGYTHIVMAATTTGKDILPRIAATLDIAQISDITGVLASNIFKRPIYAGNAIETVESNQDKHVVSVRPTSFDKAISSGGVGEIIAVDSADASALTQHLGIEGSGGDRPDLAAASIVVSGGRGVGSAENFALIEQLADKLSAAIGASRAAVDAGYVANDYQVGQTGKIVAPELYIAVGISGAIQHLAGMKSSKVIVAINKDENAPIFEVADYGLVADLFDVVPELTDKL